MKLAALKDDVLRMDWQRDQLERKPSYMPVGEPLTSFVPDVLYPFDEAMVRRIREKDPGFVPIMRYKVYRTAAGAIEVFRHHGVCRYDRHAELGMYGRKPDLWLRRTARAFTGDPAKWPFALRPNKIEKWFCNPRAIRPGSPRYMNNLPPPFIPWGAWVESYVNEVYWATCAAEREKYVEEHGPEAQARAELEFQIAEKNYREKGEREYFKRLFESATDDDERELVARQRGEVRPDRKPMAFVKQGAEDAGR